MAFDGEGNRLGRGKGYYDRFLKSLTNPRPKFVVYADKNGLKRRNLMIQKSQKLLERFVVSRIIYNIHSEQAWTEYLNQDDPVIQETLRLFHNEGAFPQKPVAGVKGKNVAKAGDGRAIRQINTLIAHA